MKQDYVGYQKLRPGRIHLFCPGCGRKMSNVRRDSLDPPDAVLARVSCERCSEGCKDSSQTFLDADGRELCCFCGRKTCEIVGGRADCDDRLVKAEAARALPEPVQEKR
jgi:hypothetical protein